MTANDTRRAPNQAIARPPQYESPPNLSLRIRDSLREFRAGLAATDPVSCLGDDSTHTLNVEPLRNRRLRAVNKRGDVDVNWLRYRSSGRIREIFRGDSDELLQKGLSTDA